MARRHLLPIALTLTTLLSAQEPTAPDAAPDATAPPANGTQLWLPHSTGRVTIDASWTVLRPADIEAATRPSDPSAEPAHTILLTTLDELREHGQPAEHLILQRTPAPGQLQLINCYASETAVKTADLLDERAVEQMRTKLLADFGEGARVVDNARTELFATGGLLMRYERTRGAITWRHDFYLVPAEKHLQYFEVVSTADEPNAQPIVEAVLRSFDGAKEGDTLQGMILGGVAGAIGGALVATWLGRRRRAALAAAGTAAGPGANAS
ncbi:MAG: hypothetical protein H6835_08420 [Planctomycetes bacterium]|nr:hypothetical protein [Planctomycetota bacterium]